MSENTTPEMAFVAAQAEMQNAKLNQTNPHFKSKFADLASVREATLPILNKHGLGIIQSTDIMDGTFVLRTMLVHQSGKSVQAAIYPLPANGKPQEIGSAITYARRYSWAAMCGISAEEDDDGNAAQEGASKAGKANNGRGKDWGKASQAKKRGDWEAFEHELSECLSVVAVDALQTEYEENVLQNWTAAWREQAHEAFEKRRAELLEPVHVPASKQGQGRKEERTPGPRHATPTDSLAAGEMMIAAMRVAKTKPDLEQWKWDNKAQIAMLHDEHFYSLKLEYGKLWKSLPESTLEAG